MPNKVSVAGGTPTWRRGMAAGLTDSGLRAIEIPDLSAFVPGKHGAAVIAWMAETDLLDPLAAFAEEHPSVPVIAVLPDLKVGRFAEAVRAGATSVVGEEATTAVYAATLNAALEGRSLVPVTILRAMAARIPITPDSASWVTEEEGEWLRTLSEGTTVAELAASIGYSERETFRMLRDTYTRIGASSRTQAIIWAARHGILGE